MQSSGIKITDVTLRDGLQSDPISLDTARKLQLFEALQSCSYSRIEITSFSHPKWIPQLSDSDAFCEALFQAHPHHTTGLMAFVPNGKGVERFLKYPIEWASLFTAVSDTFHQKNVNVSVNEGLSQLAGLVARIKKEKRKCRIYISTVFGCPYEKDVKLEKVLELVQKIADLNPDEIALSDTLGVASPTRIQKTLEKTLSIFPKEKTALHLHNTYGMALANILAGFKMGITQFDGATGGIGGCPYAKGASGNVASEEIAYLFSRENINTSVSWLGVQKAVRWLSQNGLGLQSHLSSVFLKGGEWYGIS